MYQILCISSSQDIQTTRTLKYMRSVLYICSVECHKGVLMHMHFNYSLCVFWWWKCIKFSTEHKVCDTILLFTFNWDVHFILRNVLAYIPLWYGGSLWPRMWRRSRARANHHQVIHHMLHLYELQTLPASSENTFTITLLIHASETPPVYQHSREQH